MKRSLITVLFGLMAVIALQAQSGGNQKMLSVEDTTEGIGVYPCENRHEAMVVFICREAFSLAFESNVDKELNVVVDSLAGEKRYSIVLVTQAPGVSYDGRRLKITAEGFKPYTLPLVLKDKQKFEYTVSDPYSVLRSPYFLYQERANDMFYKGEYQGAKDNYEMVRACPEYLDNKESVDQHIAICDSMIEWGGKAQEMEHFHQYMDAYQLYLKMLQHNSSNEDLKTLTNRAIQNFHSDCDAQFKLGEHYQEAGEYDKSMACFQRVVDQKCMNGSEATLKLREVRKQKSKRDEHARALFYDFGENLPIGLTFGLFYPDRVSGYISLRMNPDVFRIGSASYVEGKYEGTDESDMVFHYADNKYEQNGHDGQFAAGDKSYYPVVPKELAHEAAISFGWTCNVWEPIYLHWGIGYHGGGYQVAKVYSAELEDKDSQFKRLTENGSTVFPLTDEDKISKMSSSTRHKYSKSLWASAPLVEAGIVLKYWRVNVKFTYQFNYWLGYDDEIKELEDFYKDQRHKFYFGVGFCW